MTHRRKFLWIAVGLAGVLLAVSAADGKGFRRYFRLEQELDTLQERNQNLAAKNAEMIREIEALRKDRQAQERAAREELGFIKPGEIVINLE